MMPTTPSGTRTRSMVMPFGRVHVSITLPTGSARPRTMSRPSAMAAIRASSSDSRSRKASVAPAAFRVRDVFPVGVEDLGLGHANGFGHGGQRLVLLLRRRQRQNAGGRRARAARCRASGLRYRRRVRSFSAARSWFRLLSRPPERRGGPLLQVVSREAKRRTGDAVWGQRGKVRPARNGLRRRYIEAAGSPCSVGEPGWRVTPWPVHGPSVRAAS